jgi:PhzF family phenazine biosynthesis protein
MNLNVPFRLIDAFSATPYGGNPAGVVLIADGLSAEQMQAVAREVNASETAFICGGGDLHRTPRLRWFTPTTEVGFCGHATLAAAHAWAEVAGQAPDAGRPPTRVAFESPAGRLELHAEHIPAHPAAPLWWLRMPDPGLRPASLNPIRTCEVLGLAHDELERSTPMMCTRDDDVIVLIRSWQRLNELRPHAAELAEWSSRNNVRGFLVASLETLNPMLTVASRFFAPAAGVAEDPVTGSVHGPLATLLTVCGLVPVVAGRASLHCYQGLPGGRGGLVRVLVEARDQGYHVHIGGQCRTTIRGEMSSFDAAPA